jgi:hypothetical protein
MEQVTETETDMRPLAPAEKCRLAVLMLKLGDDGDEWPQFLHEQQERLSRQLTDAAKADRRQHWETNAGKAQKAAVRYLESQQTNEPVSLAVVAAELQTSERSVSRQIAALKAAGARKEVEPAQ